MAQKKITVELIINKKHKFKEDYPPYLNYCSCGRSKLKEIEEGTTQCTGKQIIVITKNKKEDEING